MTGVNRIIDAMETTRLWIELPRFSFEAGFMMKEALSDMGMAGVFSEGADFSGMTGKRDLFIEDVVHKAWISVDEAGTEVTVASAVPVMMGMEESVHFAADRPFIFLIRDTGTGTILFAGRVLNPLEQ
jgi:serpin B